MTKKRMIAVMGLLLVAYAGSYTILSAMGDYRGSRTGTLRLHSVFALTDIMIWQPKGVWYQSGFVLMDGDIISRGNSLGYFYAPLISLDRAIFHKTQHIFGTTEAAKKTK